MWTSLLIATALAAPPTVELAWKKDAAHVVVTAAPGEEISPDAPADLVVDATQWKVSWEGQGAGLESGVPLRQVQGAVLSGTLYVPLCDKSTGVCAPTTFALSGSVPQAKKGTLALTVSMPEAAPAAKSESHSPFHADAQAAADAAFAEAKTQGKPVLLDFSAVWCPPCNLLMAEVLHADPTPGLLEDVVVAELDVDDRRSFDIKSRYDVGGYPTVVLADADGNELDRIVGYPGKDAFLQWLNDGLGGLTPETATPEQAAAKAWRLVMARQEPGAWLEKAAQAADSEDFRLVRLHREPKLEDVIWLADHAPETVLFWGEASEMDGAEPHVIRAAQTALASAEGERAADLMTILASHSDAPVQWYAAAAAALRGSFTGDASVDRAMYDYLVYLMVKAEQPDAAVTFALSAIETFPDEPTFYLSAARTLNKAERFEEAWEWVQKGLPLAWDDNKLRLAASGARALVALDRADEASGFAQKILAEVPEPDETLQVRTGRYRDALSEFVKPVE